MCLYTNQICPKKATRDIECYKIVDHDLNTGDILSPVIGARLVFNQILNARFEPSHLHNTFLPAKELDIGIICDGFFHSYRNFSDAAIIKRNSILDFKNLERKIVRCIIPKGALYYTSTDAEKYASTHLILKEYV